MPQSLKLRPVAGPMRSTHSRSDNQSGFDSEPDFDLAFELGFDSEGGFVSKSGPEFVSGPALSWLGCGGSNATEPLWFRALSVLLVHIL
jgi:hypothetical protein